MKYKTAKRVFDLLLAMLLLILLSPLLLLLSFVVLIDTGQNPIFKQERGLTLCKYRFKIYKFRTLKNDSKIKDVNLQNLNSLNRARLRNSVSTLGKFLRRTGLDELPQLLNIIKGEMSFIGPRPLSLDDLRMIENHYPELYIKRNSLNVLPGISGLWQLNKDDNMSIKHLVEMDLKYNSEANFIYDLNIMLKSLKTVFLAKHKDAILSDVQTAEAQIIISQLIKYACIILAMFIANKLL